MKKICLGASLMLLFVIAMPAAESDVILQAQADAAEDGRSFHAFWWSVAGVGTTVVPVLLTAFCADAIPVEARRVIALTTPVAGGAMLAVVGFSIGKAGVPEARTAEALEAYGDSSLVSLYQSEYGETLTRIQRRKQGLYALAGSGVAIGAGVLGFLVVYLTK